MPNLQSRSSNFTSIGVLLGTAFPVISITIDFFRLGLPFSLASITEIFARFPLHWIILSAPLILGSVFYYFGIQFSKKEAVYIEEKKRNLEELKTIETFLSDIAKEDFNDREYVFYNPSFGDFLKSIKQTIRAQKQKDERRNWSAEGLASLNEILRYEKDLQKLLDSFLSRLVTYTGSNQGTLFFLAENEETLEQRACYAYDRKKFMTKTLHVSEGLVGSCYLERNTIQLKEVPADYINITSGLGEAPPRFIVLCPVKTNTAIEGVLELASFQVLSDHVIRFIERACDNLAAEIGSRKITERTRLLLEDSRVKAEELHSHEEEMRQNMEELQATQEEMERKSREMSQSIARLQAVIDNVETALITINKKGLIDYANSAAAYLLGYQKKDLTGLDFNVVFGIAGEQNSTEVHSLRDKILTNSEVRLQLSARKNGGLAAFDVIARQIHHGAEQFYLLALQQSR